MTAIQEAHCYEYRHEHLKKTILYLKKAGINMENDKIDIHPQKLCYACNKNISWQATSITIIGAFQCVEHSQDNCSVCEHFRMHAEGGRPTKVTRGRLTSNPTAETLQATTQPSWGHCINMFLCPLYPINLEDVECNSASVWLIDQS